jgi:anti-sigma factor RsiW
MPDPGLDRPYVTCRQLIDYIPAYLEGELNPVERSDFERHLARCESCRAYIQSYDQTMRLVNTILRRAR